MGATGSVRVAEWTRRSADSAEALLGRSECDLDLDRDARRRVEAEDVGCGVVAGRRWDTRSEVHDVEGRLLPPEGIRLFAVHEEHPSFDRPALDLKGDVNRGAAAAAGAATEGVEAPRALGITPGLGPISRAVELGPGPEAAEARTAEIRVVAVE